MASIRNIVKVVEKFTSDNSPAILTGIGATGVVSTAYLAYNAGSEAANLVAAEFRQRERMNRRLGEQRHNEDELTNREYFDLVWRQFIPPALSGALTVGAIIMANRIGTRRTAAMAAAFSLSDKTLTEYKEKVAEHIGKNKERKIVDAIAQDRVNERPIGSQQVYVTGGGEVDFFDMYTGRYFKSDMETVKKAQNDINYQILNHDEASLTDFYEKLGLPGTKLSDEVGWNTAKLLDVVFSTTMTDNDRPCIAIDFRVAPIRNYFRVCTGG